MYTRIALGALLQQWLFPIVGATDPSSRGRVAYLTDVEGGFFWLERCLEGHPFLTLVDHETIPGYKQMEWLNDDGKYQFVYGGDMRRKFDDEEEKKAAEAVVKFKENYPKRVHLVLGNRDLDRTKDISKTASKTSLEGIMTRYLEHAQPVVLIDDTAFVHGGIGQGVLPKTFLDSTSGCDKSRADAWFQGADPQQWASFLKTEATKAWDHKYNSTSTPFDFYDKMEQPYTMVMAEYAKYVHFIMDQTEAVPNDSKKEKLFWKDPCVISFLKKGGIRRVVTGHKPQYDLPSLAKNKDFEVMTCDTNYAGGGNQSRGQTMQQVILNPTGTNEFVIDVKGKFADWTKPAENYEIDGQDSCLGTIQTWKGERWWVRAKVGAKYLYSRQNGTTYAPIRELVDEGVTCTPTKTTTTLRPSPNDPGTDSASNLLFLGITAAMVLG